MSKLTDEEREVLRTLSENGVMTPIELSVEQMEPVEKVAEAIKGLEDKGLLSARTLNRGPEREAYVINSQGYITLEREQE